MQESPPFIVARPVTGAYFVNRETELSQLYSMVVEGILHGACTNAALVGLRRTGKTSILENFRQRIGPDSPIVPVFLNCYGIATRSRFAREMVDKTLQSYVEKTGDSAYLKRLTKYAAETMKAVTERISILRYADFSLKFKDLTTDEDLLIESAMNYVEALGSEKQVFFVVMLDEFQDVLRWGEDTLKRMRVIMQEQTRVCYVLAGSVTSLMHDLIYTRSSPFYHQFVEIPVKKLEKSTVKNFLQNRFETTAILCPDSVIDTIATYANGYPEYVQRIGLELYLMVGRGGSVGAKEVEQAYEHMILSLDGEFEAYFKTFSPLDTEILIALAIGRIQASAIAREVRKPLSNISKNLTMLKNYDIIEKTVPGHYRITDPVFADWLHRRFGAPAIS